MDVLKRARDQLACAGVGEPDASARLLLQHITGRDIASLLANNIQTLTSEETMQYEALLARRMNHEPVSRIIGRRAFWNATFEISHETLDPRPDTETLVEATLAMAREKFSADQEIKILDLGTGSGCIILSLLQELPNATGLALDISPGALQVARRNAAALGLEKRVQWLEGDWKVGLAEAVDIVVSNPPYIPTQDIETLAIDVRNYDPHLALDGAKDGLQCYRDIAEAMAALTFAGAALFEVGHTQASEVRDIFATLGWDVANSAGATRDFSGTERVVIVNVRKG